MQQYDHLFCICDKTVVSDTQLALAKKSMEEKQLKSERSKEMCFWLFCKKNDDEYSVKSYMVSFTLLQIADGTLSRHVTQVTIPKKFISTIKPNELKQHLPYCKAVIPVPSFITPSSSPPRRVWLDTSIVEHLILEGSKSPLPNCNLNKLFAPLDSKSSSKNETDQQTLLSNFTEEISRRTYPCTIFRPPLAIIGEFKCQYDEGNNLHQTMKIKEEGNINFTHNITANAIPTLTMYAMYVSMYMTELPSAIADAISEDFRKKLIECYDWYWARLKSCLLDFELLPGTREIQATPLLPHLLHFFQNKEEPPAWVLFNNINREYITRLLHVYEVALLKLSTVESYKNDTERREANSKGHYLAWPRSDIKYGKLQKLAIIKKNYLRGNNEVWNDLMSPITSASMPLTVGDTPDLIEYSSPPAKDVAWSVKHRICLLCFEISKRLVKKGAPLSPEDQDRLNAISKKLMEWHTSVTIGEAMVIKGSDGLEPVILIDPLNNNGIKHLLLFLWALDVHLVHCNVIEI